MANETVLNQQTHVESAVVADPGKTADEVTDSQARLALQVSVSFEGAEQDRLVAIQEAAARLLQAMIAPASDNCVWGLAESVWPALLLSEYRETPPSKVQLVLLPLSRIGQMEGKSGSLVLIGYLRDPENEQMPQSHPVVIKTLPKGDEKLRAEYECAVSVKPFAYDQKDVFAIPFRFDDSNANFQVLWSIFSASAALWANDRAAPLPKGRDLRNLIKEDDEKLLLPVSDRVNDERPLLTTVDGVFQILRNLHMPFGTHRRERRLFGEEYEWYLRGYGAVWGAEWQEAWAHPDQKLVQILLTAAPVM